MIRKSALLILFLSLSSFWSWAHNNTLNKLLQSDHWKLFSNLLMPCQKQNPDLYQPLELIRFDLMPLEELSTLIQIYAQKSLAVKDHSQKSYQLSCRANDDLALYVQKISTEKKSLLSGSHHLVLKSLPKESRKALTPQDPLFFKATDLGKKAQKELKPEGVEKIKATSIDLRNKKIIFQKEDASTQKLQNFYQISFKNFSERQVKFRSSFFEKESNPTQDLILNSINFNGAIYSPQKSTKKPLGNYPHPKKLWIEEDGSVHFHGDGHNH